MSRNRTVGSIIAGDFTMAFAAVVARTSPKGLEYLVSNLGHCEWAESAQRAARYKTLRDATREALRLPSTLRAYALPAEAA
jgi:hypothetical protein